MCIECKNAIKVISRWFAAHYFSFEKKKNVTGRVYSENVLFPLRLTTYRSVLTQIHSRRLLWLPWHNWIRAAFNETWETPINLDLTWMWREILQEQIHIQFPHQVFSNHKDPTSSFSRAASRTERLVSALVRLFGCLVAFLCNYPPSPWKWNNTQFGLM